MSDNKNRNGINMFSPSKPSKRAFILGMCFGMAVLLLLGFTLMPQSDTGDATPADLRSGYREIYMDLLSRAYLNDASLDLQTILGAEWTPELSQTTLQALVDKTPASDQQTLFRLRKLAMALEVNVKFPESVSPSPTVSPKLTEEPEHPSRISLRLAGLSLIVLAVVIAAGFLFYRAYVTSLSPAHQRPDNVEHTYKYTITPEPWPGVETLPMIQFITTYQRGDKLYDPSIAIETPDGKFWGECGVGITSALPKGKRELVPAFEVWMFDKTDTNTVTHVLISEYAQFEDQLKRATTQKHPYSLPKPGSIITLQTAALTLRAKVVKAVYAADAPQANAFFEMLSLEIAVWRHTQDQDF